MLRVNYSRQRFQSESTSTIASNCIYGLVPVTLPSHKAILHSMYNNKRATYIRMCVHIKVIICGLTNYIKQLLQCFWQHRIETI